MRGFQIEPWWRVALVDLGLNEADVLRRARLPEDLLFRDTHLPTEQFFRFWSALEDSLGDPLFSLRLTEAMRGDAFTPCAFAVLCSPDLHTGFTRLSMYKRLIAPMRLDLLRSEGTLAIRLSFIDRTVVPPASWVGMELAYFVRMARLGTREHVVPIEVTTPVELPDPDAWEAYFGVPVQRGNEVRVRFTAHDADRPFLTANPGMWAVFEPDLRRRLAELDGSATMQERVRAVLNEAIPSAQFSVDDVARRLAVSRRTLQRHLKQEGTSFQDLLREVRTTLAEHYLSQDLSAAEIGFLLGFEETTSFYRAYHSWTGRTPEAARRALASG